ncbi:hypothetical protein Pcinc_010761 [Petrolisthes cinctipes]|uniref:Uncharacterized protein n=1 Tax=Petrolisthes cinctipes TaxID=88211 RepID=A0AAE1KV11_PETCI|nr:hypothetical protein Pcinc_010761 [Petrolisthes cinctipes]
MPLEARANNDATPSIPTRHHTPPQHEPAPASLRHAHVTNASTTPEPSYYHATSQRSPTPASRRRSRTTKRLLTTCLLPTSYTTRTPLATPCSTAQHTTRLHPPHHATRTPLATNTRVPAPRSKCAFNATTPNTPLHLLASSQSHSHHTTQHLHIAQTNSYQYIMRDFPHLLSTEPSHHTHDPDIQHTISTMPPHPPCSPNPIGCHRNASRLRSKSSIS